MQSITIIDYQIIIRLWYKYGLSVSFLTVSKHKKTTIKSKYKHYFDIRVSSWVKSIKTEEVLPSIRFSLSIAVHFVCREMGKVLFLCV